MAVRVRNSLPRAGVMVMSTETYEGLDSQVKSDYALSIIIPTARYSPILVKMIRHVREVFNKKDVEIIVASTTDNPGNKIYDSLCRDAGDCKLLIIERDPSRDSRSHQKNIAVNTSKGKYIYIIDDDATPTVRLLKTILEIINQNACDAILHPVLPKPVSVWARIRMFEKIYSSFDLYQSSCRIMKRDLFIELGGYKANLVLGEDIEFQQRLLKRRPKVCVIPLSRGFEIHHGEYRSIKEYMRRAWYYGKYAKTLVQQIDPLTTYRAYLKVPPRLVSSLKLCIFAYLFYKYMSLLCIALGALLTHISKTINLIKH